MNTGALTVLFEVTDEEGLHVCKVTFGAEPTGQEIIEFVEKNWHKLKYSEGIETTSTLEIKKSPKQQLREARKQMVSQGIGTKSQQALKMQQERNKVERKQLSKAEREAERQRKFDLRQTKKKEKHKGH